MWNKYKKVIIYAIIAVIFLFIIIVIAGANTKRFGNWLMDKKFEILYEKWTKGAEYLNQRRMADKDGGATPEETIKMFLTGLKAGDIDKASKYYEVSLQDKALTSLKEEKQKYGDFSHTINYFEEVTSKGVKKCQNEDKESGGCGFNLAYVSITDEYIEVANSIQKVFFPKGSEHSKYVGLSKNNVTNIWKIKFPY